MKKKSYAVQWQEDKAVSFEVDGVRYSQLRDIPLQADRQKLQEMMADASHPTFDEVVWEQTQKETDSALRVILWVFGGISALLLLVAGLTGFATLRYSWDELRAPGVVVGMEVRAEYDSEDRDRLLNQFHYPVVRFTAEDGKRRDVQMREGSAPPSYEVGDEVTVRYAPGKPLEARIDSWESAVLAWVVPGITGFLGLAFGAVFFVVQKVFV